MSDTRILVPIAAVVRIVAAEHGRDQHVLTGANRSAPIVRDRFAVCWLAHNALGHSLHAIGRALGGRDHSTIAHATRRATALRERDAAFRGLTDRLRDRLQRTA